MVLVGLFDEGDDETPLVLLLWKVSDGTLGRVVEQLLRLGH